MLTEPPPHAPLGASGPAGQARRPPGARASRFGPDLWLVAAITAIAALLRFSTITSQSFWIDEATTVHEVGLSFGQMLHWIRLDETTPPLYFALGWVWTRIFGAGELGIRSLSALAGVATVPVVYLCGRELVSRRAGVVAAALTAVSPFMIWYSQEARSYMLFGLLSGLVLLFCARAARTRSRRDLIGWTVAAALAVLTHFFAAFLVAPAGLWLLWRLRSREVLAAGVAVAAVQLAVLPLAIGDTSHPLGWITAFPLSTRIEQIPVGLGFSELYRTSAGWGLPGAALLLAVVLALLAFGGGGRRERAGVVVAGGLGAAVILIPLALAALGHDYVFERNFMAAWIPLAVLIGAACTVPRLRLPGGLLAAVLLALFVWAGVKIDGDSSLRRPDWRAVAAALEPARGPRAIVAYDGNAAEQPLSVYLPRTRFSYRGIPADPRPVAITEVDVVGNIAQSVPSHLPAGVRLIGTSAVDSYLIERFALAPGWRLAPAAIAARAPALLGPGDAAAASVLVQR